MPLSFTYGGFDFGTIGVTVMRHSQVGLPAARTTVIPIALRDGAAINGRYLQPRIEQWECIVTASSPGQLRDRKELIAARLAPGFYDDPIQALRPDHMPDRQMNGRLNGAVVFQPTGPYSAVFELEWIFADPFKYSRTEVNRDITLTGGTTTFHEPSATDGIVAGTANAFPVWTFQAVGINAVLPRFTNVTTGRLFRWDATLPAGQYLRISPFSDFVERSPDGVTYINAMKDVNPGSEPFFMQLRAGVRNQIQVQNIEGNLNMRYRARYW